MMHCFECAAAMPDNMIYCLLCGAKLNVEVETVIRPKIPPKIVIMPPIPSRTEIAIEHIKESRPLKILYITIGVVSALIAFGLIAYVVFLRNPAETTF